MNRIQQILRIPRLSMPLFILFIVLTLTVGLFMSILFEQEHLRRVGRGFYSEHAVFFSLPGDPVHTGAHLPDILDVKGQTDYMVVGAQTDLRTVFVQGEPDLPPLLWGRFLTPEESRSTEPLALVGDSRWSEVRETGDGYVWEDMGQSFSVIGRLGTPYTSPLNGVVMIGMGAMPKENVAVGRFFIDGSDPVRVLSGIGRNARDAGIRTPDRMPVPLDPVDVMSMQLVRGHFYLLMLIGIMTLSSAVLMVSWIRNRIYRIAVLRLIGYAETRIFVRTMAHYLLLSVGGIGVAIGAQSILAAAGTHAVHTGFLRESLLVGGGTLALGLLITVPTLIRALQTDVVKILR